MFGLLEAIGIKRKAGVDEKQEAETSFGRVRQFVAEIFLLAW